MKKLSHCRLLNHCISEITGTLELTFPLLFSEQKQRQHSQQSKDNRHQLQKADIILTSYNLLSSIVLEENALFNSPEALFSNAPPINDLSLFSLLPANGLGASLTADELSTSRNAVKIKPIRNKINLKSALFLIGFIFLYLKARQLKIYFILSSAALTLEAKSSFTSIRSSGLR